MKQMTVKELKKLCEQEINDGNGDKNIVISDDNEGNGFHGLFFGFSSVGELVENLYDTATRDDEHTIILG